MRNFGWKFSDHLETEEAQRLAEGNKYWATKLKKEENDLKVLKQKEPKLLEELAKFG
eukprot:CAMPEP_0116904418 /NCGR_PEP_ID=MMETSP0467-20121206/11416_1 /TAXON_ID=283647 /ORGANISM="Mesodinium pulex, Strain SPMC105" /LENGTH=56 /DNA_ID=CAMNT_0004579077 /DNA_START=438 /DNA_END=608 /DNA_ORIENTATION=-